LLHPSVTLQRDRHIRAYPASVTIAAVILAAGSGSRFQGPTHKLLAPLGGRTVVEHALTAAIDAGLDEVVVVTGATPVPTPPGVTVLHNPDWSHGQATSLQLAIRHAAARGHEAIVVGLGDQPGIPAEAWRRVAAADAPIAVATYGGRRRNPVRLAADVWSALPVTGDEGARVLMRSHPELIREVACPGHPADIDTVEDLDRWSS
jgi:molybdenum cofactor cytidylyltransferase